MREKTAKIGLIGRAAAIFRVDEIIIYHDNPRSNQQSDLDFIALLLSYLETPQYLRKRLFKIEPRLQFAGILPPLRTPHHPSSGKTADLRVGDYREGVVLSQDKEGLLVDIGVEQPAILRDKQHDIGSRLTLQVVNVGKKVEVQAIDRNDVPSYWGYKVRVEERPLTEFVADKAFDMFIATARIGSRFNKVAQAMADKWHISQSVLIVFGAPSRGLHEIARAEGKKLERLFDFVVNTIPDQGTATVRTEEAVLATLAIVNEHFE